MTLDLQRELLLLAQAKVSPSYTHLLASHEASFPSPAKVLYFIIQDSSSSEMCPTLWGRGGGGVPAINSIYIGMWFSRNLVRDRVQKSESEGLE